MTESNISKAFDAIHDEAAKLLKLEISEEVRRGLNLIIALARYQFDVRGQNDRVGEDSGN